MMAHAQAVGQTVANLDPTFDPSAVEFGRILPNPADANSANFRAKTSAITNWRTCVS
jgi:hypothetical protein